MTIPPEIRAANCPNAELVPDWATARRLPWASQRVRDGPAGGVAIDRVYCEMKLRGALPSIHSIS